MTVVEDGGLPIADVCLILEGTYPYVRGGVSTWVHQLITGLSDLTFSLLLISTRRDESRHSEYELPSNVVSFVEVYIQDTIDDRGQQCPAHAKNEAWGHVRAFHEGDEAKRLLAFGALLDSVAERQTLSVHDALFSSEAWSFVTERYEEKAAGTSFIDWFWTWRSVHAPLLQTLIAEIPPARVYHAICTGYAGLLGVVAKRRTGRPLLLTEHGIYVRERTIDIGRADWIYEEPVRIRLAKPRANPLKQMWQGFFETIARITYDAADQIITLFSGNLALQHQYGADPKRTGIIPNGVDVARFAQMRHDRPTNRPPRVALIGRVVPIKDVRTFLRAAAAVARTHPEVEFWIAGPIDEDHVYYEECVALKEALELSCVEFLGHRDVVDLYPNIDLLVLTSVSEGQPLTILEAACAGVPTIATDVGGCRELLEGRTTADRALGPSGVVTPVGDSKATAAAIIELLADDERRRAMAGAGVARTEQFYRQADVLGRYRRVYGRWHS